MMTIARRLCVLSVLGSVAFAAGHEEAQNWIGFQTRVLILDVACDGRTFGWGGKAFPDLQRGDPFVVDGRIFPGGTIEPGGAPGDPDLFDPDSEGSIGLWTCRGHLYVDSADFATSEIHVSSIQDFVFDEATRFATVGQEGRVPFTRVILGGAGQYRGIIGEVHQEPIGVNTTGVANLRMTFTYTMIPFAPVPMTDMLDGMDMEP